MAEGKIIDPAEEAMMAAAGGGMDPAAGGAPAPEQKPLFNDKDLSAEDAKRGTF